jgi:serine/threonine protein kinase
MLTCKRRKLQESVATEGRDVFSVWNFDGRLAFEDIIRATENFDNKYIIGEGGYGKVYKAQLQDGQLVAVKRLHSTEEESIDERRFNSEMEILVQIRQRSIVKLYGFCSHPEYSFLVYEYIQRGSLHVTLENEELAKEFDWQKRAALVKDVAQAIYYLHYECNPPTIIHRDITSSNILLAKLDRAFTNNDLNVMFPLTTLSSLPKPTSDHTPLLLSLSTNLPRAGFFRCERFWLNHQSLMPTIQASWHQDSACADVAGKMVECIKATRAAVKVWSRCFREPSELIHNCQFLIQLFDFLEES